MIAHGCLEKFHSGKSAYQIFRCQKHDHGCAAADYDGIHKNSKCLDKSRFYRLITLCCRCCAWRRSTSCLIGKQTSFYSVHQYCSKASGCHLADSECFLKNPFKYSRHASKVRCNDKQSDYKITNSHYRDKKIQHFNCCILPKNDHCCHCYQYDSCIQWWNIKGILKGCSDGITDHLADSAPADQA